MTDQDEEWLITVRSLEEDRQQWKERAEAAEAALLEAKADAAKEANEANHQARNCGYAQERAHAMMRRAEAAEAALAESQRQLREMREALRLAERTINKDSGGTAMELGRIRAALATQQSGR